MYPSNTHAPAPRFSKSLTLAFHTCARLGEAVPSIDAAKKIADAFEVSMDYLVGEGVNASFDKKNLKRLQDIEKLDTDVKDKIYFVIDNIIQNVKAKKALAS